MILAPPGIVRRTQKGESRLISNLSRRANYCLSSAGFSALGWMVQTNVEDQISISKTIHADASPVG